MPRSGIHYEFVTTDARFLGEQEWRGRHWQVGDTISTPGADRTEAVWVAVEVSGTRVTFAPAREEAQPNVG